MNNFKKNLLDIISDISISKGFSREELLENCINFKLHNIVVNYNVSLNNDSEFLASRDAKKVMKAINKIQKVKDREVLKKYMKEQSKKGVVSKENN